MSLRIDRVQLDIVINGDESRKNLHALEAETRDLKAALKKLPEASDEFVTKSKRLKEVQKEMDGIIEKIGLTGMTMRELQKRSTELRAILKNLSPDTPQWKEYNQQLRDVNGRMGELRGNAQRTSGTMGSLGGIIKKFGPMLAAAFSVGAVVSFIGKVKEIRQEFEKYEAVLRNTFGSRSEASAGMAMIQKFAAATPFSVAELTESYVKLVNMGFKPTRDEMRKMGDVAASTGKSFDQLTEAIIDAQTGEFERLKEFGIRAKKEGDNVTFTFKDVQTQVDFSAESIRKYVLGLGDAVGVSGSMAAISETLEGKTSNLGDAWDRLFNAFGTRGNTMFKETIAGLERMVSLVTEWVEIPMSEKIADEQREINNLIGAITSLNVGNTNRKALLEELIIKYPDYFKHLDAEKTTNEELLKIQKQVNIELNKKILYLANEELLAENTKKQVALQKEQLSNIKQIDELYRTYVGNLKEGLSIEEKVAALKNTGQFNNTTATQSYGTVSYLDAYRIGNRLLSNYNSAAEERNELEKEWRTLTNIQGMVGFSENTGAKGGSQEPGSAGGNTGKEKGKGKKTIPGERTDEIIDRSISGMGNDNDAYAMLDKAADGDILNLLKQQRSEIEKEYDHIYRLQEKAKNNLTEQYYSGKISKERYDTEIAQMEIAHLQQMIEARQKYGDDTLSLETSLHNSKMNMYEAQFAAMQKIVEASINAGLAALEQGKSVKEAGKAVLNSLRSEIKGYIAKSVVQAIGTIPFPLSLVLGPAAALAVTALFESVVPRFEFGKYPFIGADDGRTYKAGYQNSARTGLYTRPTMIGGLGLVGEREPEIVISGPHTRHLQTYYPGIIEAIYSTRVPQHFSGAYPSAVSNNTKALPSQKDSQQDELMMQMINRLAEISQKLDNPTPAVISYSELNNAQNTVNDIKNNVSL